MSSLDEKLANTFNQIQTENRRLRFENDGFATLLSENREEIERLQLLADSLDIITEKYNRLIREANKLRAENGRLTALLEQSARWNKVSTEDGLNLPKTGVAVHVYSEKKDWYKVAYVDESDSGEPPWWDVFIGDNQAVDNQVISHWRESTKDGDT